MQHCEKCNHDATLIPSVSEAAHVDYYRCPVCGEVWTDPKEGDQPDSADQTAVDHQNA